MKHLLSVVTIGANYSPRAYQGKSGKLVTAPPPATLAQHEFNPTADGQLEHYIDGRLRAIVPPEGLASYARQWPDCAELAKALKAADH